MSLHFVTSAQPTDHVYSSDEARKTEGMIGSGGFVLGIKDKLSASMIDANTLRILEGDIIFCGRQVNITNYEEVTIQNGTPGMNSIALVVLNMKTNPSEEATIKVYEGTETDGDPVMPEYIEGDLNNGDTEAEMPLYAITKTGLSVGDPVAQFDVWVSEKEFRTSIDQLNKQTLVNIQNKHKVTYEVKAGIVTVRGASLGNSSTGGTNAGGSKNVDIGTMPEGLRPSEETLFYLSGRGGSTGNQANKIMPNGTIRLYNTSSSINWWSFTCVYPVG